MTTLMQDVRYALRQLRKTPAFTLTVLLTLALGIGANAAIFTLVNAVLLSKLPVADPATLIRLGNSNDCCVGDGVRDDGHYSFFSTDTYEQLRKSSPEFEDLAAMQAGFGYRPIIARRDQTETTTRSVMGEFVSGNYFRTFGLQPAAGRLFQDNDNLTGAPMTAVMSYQTWQHQYSGDPAVVGSTFWINTKAVTIIGIAPPGYFGDRLISSPPEFYLPIESMPVLANVPYVHDRNENWLYIIGRIKPGVSVPALQQKISANLRQIVSTYETFPQNDGKLLSRVHTVLTPGGAGIQQMQEGYGSHLRLLTWIAGLVLLIACANIANLLLVRGMGRKAEMSVRSALGATRTRVVRQLLTESLVLSILGGIAALVVSFFGTRMLLALAFPASDQVPIHSSPSLSVIAFAFGLSLVTGVIFGVAPAWIAAQAQPADALRSGARTTATGASLLQRTLVVLQAALSLVLLVGAGLFAQSLNKLQNIDLHLDSRNRYIIHVNPQTAGYSQTQLEALYRTMEERIHSIPGVLKVGITTYTPMEDNNNGYGTQVQGHTETTGASRLHVSAEYFDSVGTRVVAGRGIGIQDTSSAPAVAVLNQTLVKQLFKPGENPIGHRIGSPGTVSNGDFEIVGIVEDTAYQDARWKDHGMMFIPLMRRAPSNKGPIEHDDSLFVSAMVVQTAQPIGNMEALSRKTLAAINPNLTVIRFQTFDAQIAEQFTQERLISRLMSLFGGLALLLATIGLYGVTAYTVVRRTSEIGIRMALGAERRRVVAMIMRGAVLQTLLGLAIGIPVAIFCVRFVKTQLYEITNANTEVMIFAIVTLGIAAAVAGMIPARRAASIDPARALRTE